MITKKTKYALMVLAALAKKDRDEPQLIADLSVEAHVPKKFLELILLELKAGGIVQSKKGPGGGYYLAAAPEEVNVADVLRLTGGAIAPVGCLSRTRYERCEECPDEKTCGVRLVLRDAHEASLRVLEKTRLADMLKQMSDARQTLESAPMYYI
jgi:Rrf2 family protein